MVGPQKPVYRRGYVVILGQKQHCALSKEMGKGAQQN